MTQDSIIIEKRHKRFIKTVCKSEIVYALKNTKGFATSNSTNHENDEGEPFGIICFWAEKTLAKSCIKDNWSNYKVVEISLPEFMEIWCIGMENDGLIIGTEFDRNMFGFEAKPLELILDLTAELKSGRKELNFKNFSEIKEIENSIKAITKNKNALVKNEYNSFWQRVKKKLNL
jgi:hypothetical protein